MGFAGLYKLSKVVDSFENGEITLISLEDKIAKTTDPDEIRQLQKQANILLSVSEDGSMEQLFPIPEGTPQADIDEAVNDGAKIVDGKYLAYEGDEGKIEDGKLYVHDTSKFLTGEEWVQISTDTEGELNIISTVYNKID